MKIEPLNDYLVVKQDEAKDKSKGGIIIPDSQQKSPLEGEVIAVGPGKPYPTDSCYCNRVVPSIKVGDKVIFARYSGTEVEIDNEKYIILSEPNVFAILRE